MTVEFGGIHRFLLKKEKRIGRKNFLCYHGKTVECGGGIR